MQKGTFHGTAPEHVGIFCFTKYDLTANVTYIYKILYYV